MVNIGSNIYVNLKSCNPYVNTTLSTTEQLVVYIANQPSVEKMTHRLERPFSYVDTLACDSLSMLEQKYPSIRMAPDELKEEILKNLIVLRGLGAKKLEELLHRICRQRKHGMDMALHLLDSLLSNKIAIYVETIEKTVDDYLPPMEDRNDAIMNLNGEKFFTRLVYLPNTIQERLAQRYNHFIFNITYNKGEDNQIVKHNEIHY